MVPNSFPSNALNSLPGSRLIVTGKPVIAA